MSVVTGHTCRATGYSGSRPKEERQRDCPACQRLLNKTAEVTPNRELDARIAAIVDTLRCARCGDVEAHTNAGECPKFIPRSPLPYSTSADAALEAYGVMKTRGWHLQITISVEGWSTEPSAWKVNLWHAEFSLIYASGPTFALALCRAIEAAHVRQSQ